MSRLALALLAALAPAVAAAADGATITADLDGDGSPDRFVLLPSDADDCHTLDISTAAGQRIEARQIICGLDADGAAFEAAPGGSVRLVGTHYGIGRDKWQETLTLVSRDGEIRVGGYTFRWHDSLDPEGWGVCDLNLLTGRGTLTTEAGATAVAASIGPLPVAQWTDDPTLPECDPPGNQ